MSEAEFDRWSVHHITALNLPANWHDVILTFQPTLSTFAVTFAEAMAATEAIRLDPKFNPHSAAWQIQFLIKAVEVERGRAVREMVKRNQSRHPEYTGERSICETCSGTGLVIVPHLSCVSNGEWLHPFATCAIACVCPLGGHKLGTMKDHLSRPTIGLGEYQRKNDLWVQQMHDRLRVGRVLDRAISAARGVSADVYRTLAIGIGTPVGRKAGAA